MTSLGILIASIAHEVNQPLTADECIFLPRGIPHALIVASKEVRMIALITPGGYFDAFYKINTPAQRMEGPTEPFTVTDGETDVGETIKVLAQRGVRLLTPADTLATIPRYPL